MREPAVLRPVDVTGVWYRGRRLTYFAGCDYLRMAWHPEVRAALADGSRKLGASAGASRQTTGNLPVYIELERALARYFGVEAATLTSAGYTATLVAVQALAPDHTHVMIDERAHACLQDAAILSRLPIKRFRHRDPEDLERRLHRLGRNTRSLVLTDGLFSPGGVAAPLNRYLEVLAPNSTLLVDDAHGAGILGRNGRGTPEWMGIEPHRLVLTATLSKAFGCYGGVVLGRRGLRERIFDRSRLFIGNTDVPPLCAAAAMASLAVLRREGAQRRARLHQNASRIRETLRSPDESQAGCPGPMICLAPNSSSGVQHLQRRLLDAGIHPPLIHYPNGPAERYFRFAISSEHSAEQIADLSQVLHEFHQRFP